MVDNYIYIISQLGDAIEVINDELLGDPDQNTLNKIHKLKSEINYLRKTIIPCREMILSLVKFDSDLIHDNISVHLNELENNIKHANDSINNYTAMLLDQSGMFHTLVNSKLNEILKTLTIFSVIFIPITFIAGIYGTNFDFIPELHFKYGYFLMWFMILLISGSMLVLFQKEKMVLNQFLFLQILTFCDFNRRLIAQKSFHKSYFNK